tara:strand:+ start:413 stop:1093 length:681 start_codon:yes stop_codon:yes gene_type:complete
MKNYIFSKKINSSSSRRNLLEFLRENSNCEVGGYRIYDGIGNHSLQNPEELTWLVEKLQNINNKRKNKFQTFLEFGYAHGLTNTIINKFFNFKKIVTVDIVSQEGQSKESFFSNLRFKNIILIAGNSESQFVKEQVSLNAKYDLTFIDGGHEYKIVKNDFKIACKNMSKNATIVFHDIDATSCDGPKKLWNEIKRDNLLNKKFNTYEFVCKKYHTKYGIGILQSIF